MLLELIFISLVCFIGNFDAANLEQALLDDMFANIPTSNKCGSVGPKNGATAFNFSFSPSNESQWWKPNAQFEKYTFLVEMIHSDLNQNRTWKVRIGEYFPSLHKSAMK